MGSPARIAAAVVALALGACGSPGAATAPPPAAERSLFGTDWWLAGAMVDGAALEVGPRQAAAIFLEFLEDGGCDRFPDCPAGPKLTGHDACNHFAQAVSIEGATVIPADWRWSTLAGCTNPLGDALHELLWSERFEYSIVGDELRLSSVPAGVELTYRTTDAPFGPAGGQVLDEGAVGEVAYRLVWSGSLWLDVVGPGDDRQAPGGMSAGGDPSRINAMRGDVAGRAYLLAVLPPGAVGALYQPAGSPAVELQAIPVADPPGVVVGQFVDEAPDEWSIVALDAQGNETEWLTWLSPTATTIGEAPPPDVVAPCVDVPVGVATVCPINTHCGVTMFSTQVNGQWWKSAEGADQGDYIPAEWGPYPDFPSEVTIVVTDGADPTLTAAHDGYSMVYRPVPESEVDWCA